MKRCLAATLLFLALLFFFADADAQENSAEDYEKEKRQRLSEKSPFEKIVDGEAFGAVAYEDSFVIAFAPTRMQAPVHYLIVPKKRIATVNDVTEKDVVALGHLFLAAKALAKKEGIAESGFRLSVNTNRDAGQSVFHLHMHLVGGAPLGPIAASSFSPKATAAPLRETAMKKVTGRYQLPSKPNQKSAFEISVILENEKLFAQIGALPKAEIFPISETRFFAGNVDRQIEFVRDKEGRVVKALLFQAGNKYEALKIN